ncbi:MAG: hypothetical protein K2O40_03050, partial [Lachnospiraceae bacterium]|nr:hypothetical protein [Lachnospiraceae bacterium]
MALAVAFTCLGDMSVSAAAPKLISEPVISGDNGQMEFLEISEEDVAVEDVPETRLNAADREMQMNSFRYLRILCHIVSVTMSQIQTP